MYIQTLLEGKNSVLHISALYLRETKAVLDALTIMMKKKMYGPIVFVSVA